MPERDLPGRTLTFLFSDIEGSTQLWERHARAMQAALTRHDEILRTAVIEHNGAIVKTTGDGAYAVFASASDSIRAAVAAQRQLRAESWTSIEPDVIRARMGIHTGEAEKRDGDYHGMTLNIAARLMAASHGGQVLVSEQAIRLSSLPDGIAMKDLGRYRLKGISEPQRVLQLLAPDLAHDFPPLNAPNTAVRNLPNQPTAFAGRRRELNELRRLLLETDGRLLTLVGPGGMGKTRTAIEAAQSIAADHGERFPDGVVFVPLAQVDTITAAARAVADALGLSSGGGGLSPDRQLLAFLIEKHLLLLIDNLDHLLGLGYADFVGEMLAATPGVKLLVTSRERLNLRDETVFVLSGMNDTRAESLADEALLNEAGVSDAAQLFLQRARRVVPGFAFTEENSRAVALITRLTEGLPLSIELAAGWLTALTPQEIAVKLEKNLDLPGAALQAVPQRQDSLRAVFDGSWQLLSDQERAAFLRLSVFRGGFRREEGEAAAGVPLPVLLSLANKSFLQRSSDSRFGLHEQLRYFANELLRQDPAEWDEANTVHSRVFGDFVAQQLPRLRSEQQLPALAEIERDFDNVGVAWEWLVSQGAFDELIGRLLPGLFRFATLRTLFSEMDALLETALDRLAAMPAGQTTVPYAILKTAALDIFVERSLTPLIHYPRSGTATEQLWPLVIENKQQMGEWFDLFLKHHMQHLQGDEDVYQHWEARITYLRGSGNSWELARSLQMFAHSLFLTGQHQDRAFELLEEALILFQHVRDRFEIALTLLDLGRMAKWTGDYTRAEAYLQEAQQHLVGYGELFRRATISHERHEVYLKQGQPQKAFTVMTEEQALFHGAGRLDLLKESLHWESIAASRYSSLEHAFTARQRSMAIGQKIAHVMQGKAPGLEWDYFELGELYRAAGDPEQAQLYFGMAEVIFAANSDTKGHAYYQRALGDMALESKQFDQAETHFRFYLSWAHDTGRLWELVQGYTGLGRALCGLGRYQESEENLHQALELANNPGIIDMTLWAITAVAELYAAQEEYARGARLAAFVLQHPLSWLEMHAQARKLLEEITPFLDPGFDLDVAAEVATRTLVPEFKLTYLH